MVDKDGRTPLHYAAEIGYYNIVRALVDAGADLTIKDRGAKTAFELAWDDEIKQYLTEKLSAKNSQKPKDEGMAATSSLSDLHEEKLANEINASNGN